MLEGYKTTGVVDKKTIDGIFNMLERDREESFIGIGAITAGSPVIAQLRPQNRS